MPVEGPVVVRSNSLWRPSAWIWVAMMPGSFDAPSTTAPAPSPHRMQLPRSFQSVMRDSVSAPITSTCLAAPVLMNWSATLRA